MPANKVYYVALFPHIFMAKCTLEMRHAAMTLGAGAVAQLHGTLMEQSEPAPLDERLQHQLYGKRRLLDYYNVAGEVYVMPRLSPLAKYSTVWWELVGETCDASDNDAEKEKDMTRTFSDELLAHLHYMDAYTGDAVVSEWVRDGGKIDVEYGELSHLAVDDVFGEAWV